MEITPLSRLLLRKAKAQASVEKAEQVVARAEKNLLKAKNKLENAREELDDVALDIQIQGINDAFRMCPEGINVAD